MGNSSSVPSKPVPAPAPPHPALPAVPSRSRPLKHKKRSIVDHPQLLVVPAPGPSAPIPIPQHGQPLQLRPTPPRSTTSLDDDTVPDLLAHTDAQHTHRILRYNSTRSFGGVRRGAPQGTGWANPSPPRTPPPPPFVHEIVRSSIPLRIPIPAPQTSISEPLSAFDEDEDDSSRRSVPTQIVWRGGGKDVFLAGTFDEQEWRARERMRYDPTTNTHVLTLHVPPGTYRVKFIVDDIWRSSDDMPTATDDETGNLVNYVDVELPCALALPGPDPSPTADPHPAIMKANRRRIYPIRHPNTRRSPTTTRSPWHPPLLPPASESDFWGSAASDADTDAEVLEQLGWERGRDGVLEKWTDLIPEPLIAAAHIEEACGPLGAAGLELPSAPRLPRHLEKVILNTKSSHAPRPGASPSGASSRSSRSSRHKSKTGPALGMTSLLTPESAAVSRSSGSRAARASPVRTVTSPGLPLDKSASVAAMEQWAQADDSSVLPVPSHVVLHHLGTSAIKNGVLALSDTVRYNKKYITTIYYKPT